MLTSLASLALLYLAYSLLRSLWVDRKTMATATTVAEDVINTAVEVLLERGQFAYCRRGLLTNLTYPKSFAFWTSVAVVSIDAKAPMSVHFAAVLMVATMALVWHIGLAYLFSTPPAQRAYLRAKPILSLVTGVVMDAFGTRLLYGLRGRPVD